jgi:hypothetical protein
MNLITFLHITIESGFALFCLLAVLSIRMYDAGERKATKVLIASLLTNAAINIADALAYVYRGDPTDAGYIMVRASNFAVFVGMFALLALGNKLLDTLLEERGTGEDKRQRNAVYGIFSVVQLHVGIFGLGCANRNRRDARLHRNMANRLVNLGAAMCV